MLKAARLEIVTLSENTALGRGILGEWGLSMLVKAGKQILLLDTGAGLSAVHNADTLNQDLSRIQTIILSHGHYDHTGGLATLLARIHRPEVAVIAHPDIWESKYGKNKKTGHHRFAGIPHSRENLESLGARFSLTDSPTWIGKNILTSGVVPLRNDFESVADTLAIKSGDTFVHDPVEDDQALIIHTDLGLVVLLGCAHHGVINTVRHAQELTGESRIYMVLGGTHLVDATKERINRTIEELRGLAIQWLGVSHCTGQKAALLLAQAFGDRFFYNNAGQTIKFPFAS